MHKAFRLGLLAVLALSSCTLFNPYESEPGCPRTSNGACMSATEAYEQTQSQGPSDPSTGKVMFEPAETRSFNPLVSPGRLGRSHRLVRYQPRRVQTNEQSLSSVHQAFQKERLEEVRRQMQNPKTPILKQAKVMRVLLLPRATENSKVVFSDRFAFLIVQEPSFLLGDPFPEQQ